MTLPLNREPRISAEEAAEATRLMALLRAADKGDVVETIKQDAPTPRDLLEQLKQTAKEVV